MLYYYFKIFHIISATVLLTSMVYCCHLWRQKKNILSRVQTQTIAIIIPFALLQLFSGFSMISLQHSDFSSWWIKSNVMGFILLSVSWLGFVYFLFVGSRRMQKGLLGCCLFATLSMVFLMANKL